ncbi:DUF1232 domain-containing protein [Clostridium uliginosum]|uniref:Uncharacterized membrane protein YkvA, DUF1232 family n=1 Tax=Clostridium uliginosum TaxID=119641 RepID=A0A1I1I290_9CLOT|nr:DUF1232 domain-containing protein [Clostridium uliginosum]SFC28328.1 Uncharacterized membrane protein YkvA, DUF1232 family [Clostridium uliginosum]
MEETQNFGKLLKQLLSDKKISMGRLSIETGINKSTISRIANNKQKPNINHLKKISKAINISLGELLKAADIDIKESCTEETNTVDKIIENDYFNTDDVLKFSDKLKNKELENNIQKELNKYGQYVQTEEGKDLIHRDFNKKIETLSQTGQFISTLKNLYERFCSINITKKEFILIGAALLYFILPVDLIPDFIFPIGFIDDMIAVNLVLNMLIPVNSSIKNSQDD